MASRVALRNKLRKLEEAIKPDLVTFFMSTNLEDYERAIAYIDENREAYKNVEPLFMYFDFDGNNWMEKINE